MTAVEFHVLSTTGDDARMRYASQLVEQAYAKGERSYVLVSNEVEAQRMDETLWTFRDQAFIPHEMASAGVPSHPRIMALIGNGAAPDEFKARLINLSNTMPNDVETFMLVIEIVDTDTQRKQQARERYKQYRERGCQLETKNL